MARESAFTETPPFGGGILAVEWPLLLACCAPGASRDGLRALLAKEPDWRGLLSLAEEHGVIARLHARLPEESIPEEVQRSLEERRRAQLLSTLSMTAELFRLLERFRATGVESMVVKGPVLSVRAYGDPGLRQYVDLDFLIRSRDLLPATRALIDSGYDPHVPIEAIEAGKIPGEYLFMRPGTRLLVELHTERTFRYFPRPLPMEDYFERKTVVSLDGNCVPALSAEDEFVLVCIHGAKHFWERLMWVTDVAAMAGGGTKLDWNMVQKSAEAVGAERMVHVALRLVGELLHTEIPMEMKDAILSDRPTKRICERIGKWLPYAGFAPPTLRERAIFRIAVRGGLFSGAAYLLRLSLSPTEEDWVEGAEGRRPWISDVLRRPFRLMKKYGQDGKT